MRNLLLIVLAVTALAGCVHSQPGPREIFNDHERVCGRWQTVQEKDKAVSKYETWVLSDGNGRPLAYSADPDAERHPGGYTVIRCYNGYPSP